MSRPALSLLLLGGLALGACSDSTAPAPLSARSPAPGTESIAAIAIAGDFTELVAALSYVDQELDAGLIEALSTGTSQRTVFAPTDAAFEDLYALLTTVLGAPIDEITDLPAPVVLDVLRYHLVPGRRAANSVVPKNAERPIMTAIGESFSVRSDGTIRDRLSGLRDDATIVAADISASNGVVHAIDAVLVPASVVRAITQ